MGQAVSEKFSRLQLQMFVIIADVGEADAKSEQRHGKRWDGTVRWRPNLWFKDSYPPDTISRALRALESRGYVERIRTGKNLRRTTRVKLTPQGHVIAKDAKFGRIKPLPPIERGE
ncbi:MAG: hypothetical protein WC211_03885 [Dehalococcoidia bacterium]